MDYRELIELLEWLRGFEIDHSPDGWPAIRMRNEAANAIEYLLAENERLKHNLATTEQTMREYQELAAKRLEEIERLKDLCTTMDGQLGKQPCQNNRCLEYNRLVAELAKYRDAPVVAYQHRDGMLSCRLPGGGVPGIDWALLMPSNREKRNENHYLQP